MKTDNCDRSRIDAFFSKTAEGTDSDLANHLETCADCRQYFDEQAAAPGLWSEARQMLTPSDFDLAGTCLYSAGGLTGEAEQDARPAAVQDVLDALSPTDDPHCLGRLGSYEVTGVVGVGGMGAVLKAVDPSLDRVVAVKVMAPRLANNSKARIRFSREARAAAAVLHPNVIPIHSVSGESSLPYLVMAYVRGGSLKNRLQQEGSLPVVEVLRIGSQIAAGLAAAHDQGLVHRDIKPENVLLEEGVDRVTITDFGLARAVDDNTVTQAGAIAGTPMYMSPEQARGEQVDQQSDLFSLGSVLYEMCTGQPPYQADTSYGVMRRIIDEVPVPIRQLNPGVPEWLAGLAETLMAKDKADRFRSASEVHKLLEACLSHVQQPNVSELPELLRQQIRPEASPKHEAAPQRQPAGRRRFVITTILLTAVLVPSVFLLLPYLRDDETRDDNPGEGRSSAAAVSADKKDSDRRNILGTWQVTYSENNGDVVPREMLKDLQLVISKDTIITNRDGSKTHATYTIDPSASPAAIDIAEGNSVQSGIYELLGDTLRLCFEQREDGKRPTAFESRAGTANSILFILKRVDGPADAVPDTADDADGLTVAAARALIPEAASMTNETMQKLAESPTAPTADSVENQSLTLLAFTLDLREQTPDQAKDFRILSTGVPKPATLAKAMSLSRWKGYISVIQPDYITDCTCKSDKDTAQGTVSFTAPELYRGTVEFTARRRRNGKWRIEEFRLPNYGITLAVDDNGLWRRTDAADSDAADASLLFEIPRSEYPSSGLAFSPDGRLLAESMFRKVRVWSVAEQKIVQQFTTEGKAHSPTFSPDGSQIVVADGVGNLEYESAIRSWDLQTRRETTVGQCIGLVTDLRFSADGRRLAAAASYGQIMAVARFNREKKWYGGEVMIWDLNDPQQPTKIDCPLAETPVLDPDNSNAFPAAYSAAAALTVPVHLSLNSDGSRLVAGTRTGLVKVFDTESGKVQLMLEGDKGTVHFSEDDQQIRCATKTWNAESGVISESRSSHPWITSAGPFAVLVTETGDIAVVDKRTGRQTASLKRTAPLSAPFAVTADGRYLACGASSAIRVHDLKKH